MGGVCLIIVGASSPVYLDGSLSTSADGGESGGVSLNSAVEP